MRSIDTKGPALSRWTSEEIQAVLDNPKVSAREKQAVWLATSEELSVGELTQRLPRLVRSKYGDAPIVEGAVTFLLYSAYDKTFPREAKTKALEIKAHKSAPVSKPAPKEEKKAPVAKAESKALAPKPSQEPMQLLELWAQFKGISPEEALNQAVRTFLGNEQDDLNAAIKTRILAAKVQLIALEGMQKKLSTWEGN